MSCSSYQQAVGAQHAGATIMIGSSITGASYNAGSDNNNTNYGLIFSSAVFSVGTIMVLTSVLQKRKFQRRNEFYDDPYYDPITIPH